MNNKLSKLRKLATASSERRGHSIVWKDPHCMPNGSQAQYGQCQCGAWVQVEAKPAPNSIDVGGTAVALSHPIGQTGQKFEGSFNACAHRITFSYWGFKAELTPQLKKRLTDEAEERARYCIAEDFSSGELNCSHATGQDEEEIRGWWKIADADEQ